MSSASRWPVVGLAIGLGTALTEWWVVVRPLLSTYATGAPGALLVGALATVAFCTAVDAVLLALVPAMRRSTRARSFGVCATTAGVALAAGEDLGALLPFAGALLAAGLRWRPVRALVALGVVWAVLEAWPSAGTARSLRAVPPGEGPSIALVVLDTVRVDHTSAYGYARDTTPALAALAERGIRFERAYATSCWSLPSHASLFTGLLPARHGAHYESLALDAGIATLAARLAASGYATAAFSANPWISPGSGLVRGFSHFQSSIAGTLEPSMLFWRIVARLDLLEEDKGGRELLAGLRRWHADRDERRPYFLFVNLMEAHAPYHQVPRRHRRRFAAETLSDRELEAVGRLSFHAALRGSRAPDVRRADVVDLYDGAIRAADAYLGEILSLIGDEAIVFVTSDHGELLGEHGGAGHATMLYEELIRVPLVVAGPGISPPRRIEAPVSLVDVAPTILSLAGVAPPAGSASDGIDLAPLIAGGAGEERSIVAEQLRPQSILRLQVPEGTEAERASRIARKVAVVRGQRKRVRDELGSDRGFDLAADPEEAHALDGSTLGIRAEVPVPPGLDRARVALDEGERRALRRLGYLE